MHLSCQLHIICGNTQYFHWHFFSLHGFNVILFSIFLQLKIAHRTCTFPVKFTQLFYKEYFCFDAQRHLYSIYNNYTSRVFNYNAFNVRVRFLSFLHAQFLLIIFFLQTIYVIFQTFILKTQVLLVQLSTVFIHGNTCICFNVLHLSQMHASRMYISYISYIIDKRMAISPHFPAPFIIFHAH